MTNYQNEVINITLQHLENNHFNDSYCHYVMNIFINENIIDNEDLKNKKLELIKQSYPIVRDMIVNSTKFKNREKTRTELLLEMDLNYNLLINGKKFNSFALIEVINYSRFLYLKNNLEILKSKLGLVNS